VLPLNTSKKTSSTKDKVSFEEAARALECDESEERFDAALRKIAAHKPPKDSEAVAPKSDVKPTKETR
jgi:hypothetical protein